MTVSPVDINSICANVSETASFVFIDGIAFPKTLVQSHRILQSGGKGTYSVGISPPEETCLGSHLNVTLMVTNAWSEFINPNPSNFIKTSLINLHIDFVEICNIWVDSGKNPKYDLLSGISGPDGGSTFSPETYDRLYAKWLKWLPNGAEIEKLIKVVELFEEIPKPVRIKTPIGEIEVLA